ncbi:maleylpyruvate isomerase family mycothiol-dependent enzyme [Dactylosporangium sp. McL0621]|uniref:maleylpyruvate isomerase family mycothiol-dependent enzyme n=1 Tax=Dactylosporangium sp. McL0621 TaxID=3415678 RepID=UPI003CEAD4C8
MFSGQVRLLQHAICYASESVDAVVQGTESLPTPCEGWDLQALLLHLNRSIDELHQSIALEPADRDAEDDDCRSSTTHLAATFRSRAGLLLQSCVKTERAGRRIAVGDLSLTSGWVVVVGAAEIAVHGWDISVACGFQRSIPAPLALGLLSLLQLVVDDAWRQSLFGPAIAVSPLASPSDQLVAFLGRRPFSSFADGRDVSSRGQAKSFCAPMGLRTRRA